MASVRKHLMVVVTVLSLFIAQVPSFASDNISIDDFSCAESDAQKDTIDIRVSTATATELMARGITAVRARLYSNDGISQMSTPSLLTQNSDFIFRFQNLKPQKYSCYLALISNGVQGTWSEPNTTRLGEIPKCKLGYNYSSKMSLDGKTEISPIETCRLIPWRYEFFNDGFDRYFSISMETYDPESESFGDGPEIQIFCDRKKLEVYVWAEYADGLGWIGTGQVKFDSSNSKKFAYQIQKDFDGIALKDSKSFMSSLIKAKSTFGFKIPTVDGYETTTYLKGNLLEYRSMFVKAGCKF